MNHFLNTLRLPVLNRLFFNGWQLRRMGAETAKGEPVRDTAHWAQHAAVQSLVAPYAQLMLRPNYFGGMVWLTLLVGMVLVTAGGLAFSGNIPLEAFGLSQLAARLTAMAVVLLGVISLGAALGRDWGPELITGQTYADSRERLSSSLDQQVHPASMPMTLLLLSFVMADGALAGTSIIGFFKAYFTPGLAMAMAVLWGVLVGVVMWELSSAAADENCVNNGRRMARLMDAGTSEAERNRMARFMELVGTRIGIDLEDRTGYARRMTFLLVVIVLAAGSVLLRTGTPPGIPASEPALTAAPVWLATDEEISVPGPTGAPAATGAPVAEGARADGLMSALLLACMFVASGVALYWSKSKGCFLNRAQSPADYAATQRFRSEREVQVFNRNHAHAVIAALDQKLQRFTREVNRAKRSLRPQDQLLWAPCKLSASDLIGAQWAGNVNQIGS